MRIKIRLILVTIQKIQNFLSCQQKSNWGGGGVNRLKRGV